MEKKTVKLLLVCLIGAITTTNGQRVIKPASSNELQGALAQASQGDTIQMLPMVYRGDFVASANGAKLTGDYNSTIESDGVGLTVRGSNWKLGGFWIKGPTQGLVIEGNNNFVEGVVLQKTGQAIVVRGEGNTVKACVISEADLGIILEKSKNTLRANSVNIQTPAIIVPKDSCCNVLDGNVANGEVNIEGSGNKLNGNVCNHGLYVTGCDNEFSGNVANGASFPKHCQSHDKGGNVYRGLGPGDTDLPNPNQPKDPGYYQQPGPGPNNPGYYQSPPGPNNPGNYQAPPPGHGHGQPGSVPVQVFGNSGGPAPKCSCSCNY